MGHVVEALPVGDVVDDDDSVGIAVVAVGDGPEPLLPGRVPLSEPNLTRTSLTLSPLTVTVLVF